MHARHSIDFGGSVTEFQSAGISDLGFQIYKKDWILILSRQWRWAGWLLVAGKNGRRFKVEGQQGVRDNVQGAGFISAFPIPNSIEWLRTRRRTFFGNLVPLYRLRSIRDTDRITYRCFLPDLTRFVTVCCVVSNQNGPRVPNIRSLGGNSAPHKRISGKGHR